MTSHPLVSSPSYPSPLPSFYPAEASFFNISIRSSGAHHGFTASPRDGGEEADGVVVASTMRRSAGRRAEMDGERQEMPLLHPSSSPYTDAPSILHLPLCAHGSPRLSRTSPRPDRAITAVARVVSSASRCRRRQLQAAA
jgi:hypothetical protein